MARIILGFAFEERSRTRLKEMAARAGLSQTQALEALITGSGIAGAQSAIAVGRVILKTDEAARFAANRSPATRTKAMSAADIEVVRERLLKSKPEPISPIVAELPEDDQREHPDWGTW